MMRKYLCILLTFLLTPLLSAQTLRQLAGTVVSRPDNTPVEAAVVLIPATGQWAVTDAAGKFTLRKINPGKVTFQVSCLGFADATFTLEMNQDRSGVTFHLDEDNLALEQAVVTARENTATATTSRIIDRKAMDHMQMLNVTDLSALLPGGKTISPDLTGSAQKFAVRGTSFGTAVEVDGMRLSNNASLSETAGVSTRNLSSANIESVEVITGVPSVEYGDLSSGIVKIRTKAGKSPWQITLTTNPRTKQISLGKGFQLGSRAGILNVSADRTRSWRNLASPYSTYTRNALSLNWSHTLNRDRTPVSLSAGLSGNIGGMNTEADPDAEKDTYTRTRDNVIRGNVSLKWLLNKPWITNLEWSASAGYADQFSAVNTLRSSASAQPALHGMQEGYFVAQDYDVRPDAEIVMLPPGYWYELGLTDSKPFDWKTALKATWAHGFRKIHNRLKIGAEWTGSHNEGQGKYYDDLRRAPSWRPYVYADLPAMNNLAVYMEESAAFPVGKTSLDLVGGLRAEQTRIRQSAYGSVRSLSPRANARWTLIGNNKDKTISNLSLRGSWGVAYKLPSFNVLYPQPGYADVLSFTPGALADGSAYYAYYILPRQLEYNAALRWQHNILSEIGVEMTLGGVDISLSAWRNRTLDPYTTLTTYQPYSFSFTGQRALDGSAIPIQDRQYAIDPATGIVTIHDKTHSHPDETVPHHTRNTFVAGSSARNGSPVTRNGLEWVVDFGQIRPLKTSFRVDGTYARTRSLDTVIRPYYPGTRDSEGNYYPYVGFYTGGDDASNGSVSESVDMNLTIITHIPKIRMILSLRLEGGLYSRTQALSERADGKPRSWSLAQQSDYESADTDIYGRDRYSITYPDYYIAFDNPQTPLSFAEQFAWAKENDPSLYSQLKLLTVKSNYGYTLNERRISPYGSANFSVTKEISDLASISFYANNFLQNMGKVTSTQTGNTVTLYENGYIPQFYYGLTLRLKIR